MKKKKKTNIEENKASMSKKIGKYAVIVVLYIALVSTLAFIIGTINLIVNADSSIGFSTWKNAYAPSSIEIATSNGSIICGNNDVFESNSSNDNVAFDDYYSVAEEIEEEIPQYINSIDVYWGSENSPSIIFDFSQFGGTDYFLPIDTYYDLYLHMLAFDFNYIISTNGNFRLYFTSSSFTIAFVGDGWNYRPSIKQYNTNTNIISNDSLNTKVWTNAVWSNDDFPGIDGPSASINYKHKDNNIMTLSNIIPLATSSENISIKRVNNAIYNSNGYYDVVSSIDSDIITNFYLSFTRDFVVQYSDFSSGQYRYDYQATDEFVITKGYYLNYYDLSGVLQRVNINSSMSYDSNDIVSLLPTLNEITLEIGEDNINQSDIFLIEDLYVQISCPLTSGSSNNHTFYWVGVNNTRYSTIVNDLPNQFWKTTEFNVGEFLLDSVNSFLGFELIPGFSLLSLLALVIGIPLLIYILKLFLGG